MSKEEQELLGEAYENYTKALIDSITFSERVKHFKSNGLEFNSGYPNYIHYSQEEFIDKCKTNPEFSQKWGLKIEERELSLEERFNIRYPGGKFSVFQENYPNTHKRNDPNGLLDAFDIPTKLITITYNNKTIESYE